jgi:hypothetical protein
MPQTANVNTPSARYLELEKMRCGCRDLMGGVEVLKSGTKAPIYLPRNPSETKVQVAGVGEVDPWAGRVARSRLNNMFQDAVEECVGKVFAKDIDFADGTPKPLIDFCDDVDGRGTDLQTFAMACSSRSVAEGNDFILVDYPPVDANGVLLEVDEKRLGLAPYWTRYSPESVIDWEFANHGKKKRLVKVRLRETASERDPANEWGKVEIPQVRVLRAGNPALSSGEPGYFATWEVWRKVESGQGDREEKWAIHSAGILKPQVDIPLVEMPTDLTAPFEAIPPYLDLKHLTIAHYRKLSDLDNAQHAVGYPIFHWAGGELDVNGAPVGMGPNRFLVSRDAAAKAEFVEPAGTSWDSLQKELDRMEAQGKSLASEPFESSGALTATGEAIRASRRTSKLSGWVQAWQNSLNSLFYYTAQYLGMKVYGLDKGWGGVVLNTKFIPVGQNAEGARLALDANLAGKISNETLFEALQRAELVPEELTFEEESNRIAEQPVPEPTDEDRGGEDLTEDPPVKKEVTA